MLLTKKLVDQGYTLEELNIYFRKFYGRYNDLLQTLSFIFFAWPNPLLMCVTYEHTAGLTSPDMTGYTINSTAGTCPYQVKFTLPEHLFTLVGYILYCIQYWWGRRYSNSNFLSDLINCAYLFESLVLIFIPHISLNVCISVPKYVWTVIYKLRDLNEISGFLTRCGHYLDAVNTRFKTIDNYF